jgi:hypothetical protein
MTRGLIDYLRRHHLGLLALFVALGGTAWAVAVAPNSVGTRQIRDGAVRSAEVRDHSIKGVDIDESSLPTLSRCPTGFTRVVDVCYTPERPASGWTEALHDCVDEGLRLPTVPEAELIPTPFGVLGFLWTSDRTVVDPGGANPQEGAIQVINQLTAPSNELAKPLDDVAPYRCVTSPFS